MASNLNLRNRLMKLSGTNFNFLISAMNWDSACLQSLGGLYNAEVVHLLSVSVSGSYN